MKIILIVLLWIASVGVLVSAQNVTEPTALAPVTEMSEAPASTVGEEKAETQPTIPIAASTPGIASFGELVDGLPATVRDCSLYMGAQVPNDTVFELDTRKGILEKSQGRLPVTIGEGEKWEPDELDEPVSLAACIGQCTLARQCNYITYRIITNNTGECISYRINSDCHLDQDDKDCLISLESSEALGMNLGECPFSAKPEGGLGDASWALFRKVRSSTGDGLAIAASVLTIFTAVLGAPCTAFSRLFKA